MSHPIICRVSSRHFLRGKTVLLATGRNWYSEQTVAHAQRIDTKAQAPFDPFGDVPYKRNRPVRMTDDLDIQGPNKNKRLEISGNELLLVHTNRKAEPIPGQWLRDMCACPSCRNQVTQQRNVNVFRDHNLSKITALERKGDSVEITFADNHVTTIHQNTVFERGSRRTEEWRRGWMPAKLWDSRIAAHPPTVPYSELLSGTDGMKSLTRHVRSSGFVFVVDMPATPDASQSVLESIGPIRNTHYGGFYDFTADLSSKDTAYTSEALEPHTDNTYFTEPAGLQALHMLSHTDGSGGESILVDGFNVANILNETSPHHYSELSTREVSAHASGNEGISIQSDAAYPTLRHHPQQNNLMQVRWNNADRAGVAGEFLTLPRWYEAATEFDRLLNDSKNQYVFQLKPGTMLIFDNWRVLHGRTAFTGKRRMCGGYINRDDFVSKFRTLNSSEEELRASTVTG